MEHSFEVRGFDGLRWLSYERGKNFEAFFIIKK
jgi:hypothetical protein